MFGGTEPHHKHLTCVYLVRNVLCNSNQWPLFLWCCSQNNMRLSGSLRTLNQARLANYSGNQDTSIDDSSPFRLVTGPCLLDTVVVLRHPTLMLWIPVSIMARQRPVRLKSLSCFVFPRCLRQLSNCSKVTSSHLLLILNEGTTTWFLIIGKRSS